MLRHVSLRVRLDEQVERAGLVVPRNGSVRPGYPLEGAIWLPNRCTEGDMLADREPEDGLRSRQVEPVARRTLAKGSVTARIFGRTW